MGYNTWDETPEAATEREGERRAYDYENKLEERCEDLAQEVVDLSVAMGRLEQQVSSARTLMLEALQVAEGGASMPYVKIDSLLTRALGELGCASCGKPITAEDMQTMCVCRHHGVHATGDCYAWAKEVV